jgi:hypothetical protein
MPGIVLFGIHLRGPAVELLDSVEKLYGKPISERIDKALPEGVLGYADVSAIGEPVIAISDPTGRTEENIVHELFHLKMQAEGYPLFEFSDIMSRDGEYLRKMRELINDPLSHSLFFPQMKAMGLDPTANLRAQYELNRKSPNTQTEDFLATYYFKLAMETADESLLDDAAQWYRAEGWHASLETGKALVEIVRTEHPHSPREMISTFIECANRLLEGKAHLKLARIDVRTFGMVQRKFAILEIAPS